MIIREFEAKLKANGYLVPTRIVQEDKRLYFHFAYNKALLEEIKSMEGRKYHGYDEHNPRKVWSIPTTARNLFQLDYLLGNDPYKRYDAPLIKVDSKRPLRDYQLEMESHVLTRHYCIIAGEMGLGKTLSVLEALERAQVTDVIYVAPRSALESVELEVEKWGFSHLKIRFVTYEGLKKIIENWPAGVKAPQALVCDEASRCKNFTAQRTQAAKHLADSIRSEWGEDGYVVLMSGTPAPKSPADWWSLAEIACPGFLKEGDIYKFRERLGIFIDKETVQGAGSYKELITWKDDEKKCNICGELKDHTRHDPDGIVFGDGNCHTWQQSRNEIAGLYNRLKGLVIVKRKKDCLSLPEKQYKVIKLKPTQSILNAAKLIRKRAPTTIAALTLLRELSDGFQYEDYEFGERECPLCQGTRITDEWYDPADPIGGTFEKSEGLEKRSIACYVCDATGKIAKVGRQAKQVPCAKDEATKDLLDLHSDVGRFVIYCGFEGSVDRVVSLCQEEKWNVVRVDGRGWHGFFEDGWKAEKRKDYLKVFQRGWSTDYEKIVFIGQAGAAGMGLTLTASPSILYFSNSFNGEDRDQSEDRIHRLGMDENRGATIYDFEYLDTDALVLKNLKQKRRLQDMTLGELESYLTDDTARSV